MHMQLSKLSGRPGPPYRSIDVQPQHRDTHAQACKVSNKQQRDYHPIEFDEAQAASLTAYM